MTPFTVLVPLDGSVFSRQVVPALCRLFPPQHYSLILLRVADEPESIDEPAHPRVVVNPYHTPSLMFPLYLPTPVEEQLPDDSDGDRVDQVRRQLERELRESVAYLQGYHVSVAVRFGDPADEIVRFVEQEDVDLVAMATHARGGIRRMVLGSVAASVLRRVDVPVLMLRPVGVAEPSAAEGTEPAAVPA